MILCEYGCGQVANHQFKNGRWCCSEHYNKCSNMKKNQIKKIKEKWQDPNSKYNDPKHINKITTIIKKNLTIPGFRENQIKKIKEKWQDPNSKFNNKEYRNKLKIIGKKRLYKKINNKNHMCDYGCNKIARYYFPLSDRYCCSKQWQSCPEKRKVSKNTATLSISKIKKKYPIFAKVEQMRYNPDKLGKKEIQVHCKNHNCPNSKEQDGWFTPKNRDQFFNRVWAIEKEEGNDGAYFYCSEECKQECPLYHSRGSDPFKNKEELYTQQEYQIFREEVLNRENYICEYCEKKANHVHHSRPQKLEPGFVLDPDYGIACCEECHYKYGHKTGTKCSTGNLAKNICSEVI